MHQRNFEIILTATAAVSEAKSYELALDEVTSDDGYLYIADVVLNVGAALVRTPHGLPWGIGERRACLYRDDKIKRTTAGGMVNVSEEFVSDMDIEADLVLISTVKPNLQFVYLWRQLRSDQVHAGPWSGRLIGCGTTQQLPRHQHAGHLRGGARVANR